MASKMIVIVIGLAALANCQKTILTTDREPSLQAYGLPKRILASNGYIERINLGNSLKKIDTYPGDPTGTKKKSTVNKHGSGIDAAFEILHLDSSAKNLRDRRSIDNEESSNNVDDLQAEESKVFRPLFVYRQQVARRQRAQQEKKESRNTKSQYYNNNKNSMYYYPQSG